MRLHGFHPDDVLPNDIPLRCCQCGCGRQTKISKYGDKKNGVLPGEYRRFVKGHWAKTLLVPPKRVDMGYETPCWIWQNAINPNGYGAATSPRTHKTMRAHRVAYELVHGRVPSGLVIDHLCKVKSCVNPDHLEAVTNTENVRRGLSTKLTQETVNLIRSIGYSRSMRDMAKEFGVSPALIGLVRQNKRWTEAA